ncbi:MAG: bifunctional UDP-N-acetylglucosamine diphosphorylase/glucosamine-1-phosphate N-acetyltransferase GlmU [Pseudomonadota bacterium]
MATQLVLLAAGQGKRMKSDRPKVLHAVAGRALFLHALDAARSLDLDRKVVVVGNGAEAVEAAARADDPSVETVLQADRLGTGHAVAQAAPLLADAGGQTLILYGDTPFIRPETLAAMAEALSQGADLVVLGFDAADPAKYGRLITDGDVLERIVEYNDASEAERAVTLCNSGVMMGDTGVVFDLVARLDNANAAGEYYLTDLPGLARDKGLTTRVVRCDEDETLGVNSRADLAAAEAVFQTRARKAAMLGGVTLEAPQTVYFSHDTALAPDVRVEPNVVFGPGVRVESRAVIRAFSHLEGARVAAGAVVGPYARLRPGAEIGARAKVGNFVEIKNASLAEGAKANHLTYLGDASVGAGANIGAGAITCNYDGVGKHKTQIGAGAFVGSNTLMVAPVSVGEAAVTAAGSVITEDVPAGDLAIARSKQTNKKGFGAKLMETLRAKHRK